MMLELDDEKATEQTNIRMFRKKRIIDYYYFCSSKVYIFLSITSKLEQ